MPNNTLLAVVTFPSDLFYPVGVTTVGIFVRKGVPHPPDAKVLWVWVANDGLLKSKGKRLPNAKAKNDLEAAKQNLRYFYITRNHPVPNVHQLTKADGY